MKFNVTRRKKILQKYVSSLFSVINPQGNIFPINTSIVYEEKEKKLNFLLHKMQ